MKIAIGSDHAGFELKALALQILSNTNYDIFDIGTKNSQPPCDYPDIAKSVVDCLLSCKCNFGILICASGIGMSIAANRYKGIRAALCHDLLSAKLARNHNRANILCMGQKFIKATDLKDILDTFLSSEFDNQERHIKRIQKIDELKV